jgi:ankyrin repeat protein
MSNLVTLGWLMVFVGGLLLLRGLWPRTVGDHPHCPTCEYDLFGLPPETQRCPECNEYVAGPAWTVRRGKRVRRWRLALWGLVIGIAGYAGSFGAKEYAQHIREQPRLFMKAVETGDVATVDRMLKLEPGWAKGQFGPDVGFSPGPVTRAIWHGQDKVLQRLLAAGASPDGAELGDTPLMHAVERNAIAMASILIQHGADLNKPDRSGNTPLHHAAERRLDEWPVFLLKGGADPKAVNRRGETVLHLSARHGNQKLSLDLIDRGVDPNARDNDGRTPLHAALAGGNSELARALMKRGADLTLRDKVGLLPGQDREGGALRELLWHLLLEADTPEKLAAFEQMLSDAPALAARLRWSGLLVRAAQPPRPELMKYLLAIGVDPNASNEQGETALGMATFNHEKLEVLDLLLDGGARLDAVNTEGETPLHKAARWYRPEEFDKLLARDPDVTTRDKHGCTALHTLLYAHGSRLKEIRPAVDELRRRGVPMDVHLAAVLGDRAAVEKFITEYPSRVRETVGGWTPLHAAVRGGHKEIVDLLLDRGADINAELGPSAEPRGGTALHLAYHYGMREMMLHLVKRGADLRPNDRLGYSPLGAAIQQRWPELVRAMIERGADIHAANRSGNTMLDLALNGGDKEIIALIQSAGGKRSGE